ncbi:MAG: 4Fe-4S binding protein [Phycisphaerales bacterium]|nr:4Fe-4S binding protein [Phycisphaerales bacterium]
MSTDLKTRQVVFTDHARCRDCYRCLRACPVKAIQMHDGQAAVVEERCIACGTCIRECPQQAKSYRRDLEPAASLIESGYQVAASIAPSFAAVWNEWERKCIPSALRKLGFVHVSETAIGAYEVARATRDYVNENAGRAHICTACPAVVNYVEYYEPQAIGLLTPIVSPMIAHARHIRGLLGADVKVVFIGPCVAKKAEADRPEYAGLVDCVLTFAELTDWFQRTGIDLAKCEASAFDEEPVGESRYFPLPGGMARTAAWSTDLLDTRCEAVSGFASIRDAIQSAGGQSRDLLIEPLFCVQGCVCGPGGLSEANAYEQKRRVLSYAGATTSKNKSVAGNCTTENIHESNANALMNQYRPRCPLDPMAHSEEAIRSVLEKTGKARKEDQLNCGACGYLSCRAKAIAVLEGMAEPEMCIPHMRRLAEQRTDRIIETSPNGIVILDERLKIMHMNAAFRRYFMCSDAVCGKHISYLMDPANFERLVGGEEDRYETTSRHKNYNLICHQILYRLPEEKQYVGIFVNIAPLLTNQKKLEQLREQTTAQARELLEHQVKMAQEMARFLGESTARGEELVRNLLKLSTEQPSGERDRWLWDTYT